MILRKLLSSLTILVAALSFANLAVAEESPSELLETTVHEVIDILHSSKDVPIEESRNRILELLESRFSFDIIIRRALGRNWNELNEKQQDQITLLITDLLIRAYTSELQNGKKPEITFTKTEELSSNKLEITSTVTYKDKLVTVSYRLANITNRGWQVYDVLVEGVSMVSNYRKQFDEHFQTKSAADLIKLLQEKVENFDA